MSLKAATQGLAPLRDVRRARRALLGAHGAGWRVERRATKEGGSWAEPALKRLGEERRKRLGVLVADQEWSSASRNASDWLAAQSELLWVQLTIVAGWLAQDWGKSGATSARC